MLRGDYDQLYDNLHDDLHNLGPWVNIGGVGADIGSLHQLLTLPRWLDLVKGKDVANFQE